MRIFLILPILMTFPQVSLTLRESAPVGDPVTLPCIGKAASHLPADQLQIKWELPSRPVWDLINGKNYTGPGFENRVEVAREKIGEGDFSLTIHHTKLSDEGTYSCFYQGRDYQEAVFLQEVTLILRAHTETRSVKPGEDLSVPVFADEVEVLFNNTVVYPKSSDTQQDRVSVREGYLIIHRVTQADQGSYTVRDRSTKRAVSVITVTVEDTKKQSQDSDKSSDQGDGSTGVTGGVLGAAVGLAAAVAVAVAAAAAVAAGVGIRLCRRRNPQDRPPPGGQQPAQDGENPEIIPLNN
ncbi:CD276 antigen-like [Lepisosteus oculatus]|uniref:CD276 antigen-like n=1 Tax=Lepisosteus oculatus TaxID=7918 RepID=UPI0035F518DF